MSQRLVRLNGKVSPSVDASCEHEMWKKCEARRGMRKKAEREALHRQAWEAEDNSGKDPDNKEAVEAADTTPAGAATTTVVEAADKAEGEEAAGKATKEEAPAKRTEGEKQAHTNQF